MLVPHTRNTYTKDWWTKLTCILFAFGLPGPLCVGVAPSLPLDSFIFFVGFSGFSSCLPRFSAVAPASSLPYSMQPIKSRFFFDHSIDVNIWCIWAILYLSISRNAPLANCNPLTQYISVMYTCIHRLLSLVSPLQTRLVNFIRYVSAAC